jgi:Tol biopolymer transport system component
MRFAPGYNLGPYEIVAPLGAGGMGEVYRARDPRLGRDVAIKVLPQHFANDREYLDRFEQEARAAAALNHPNILAVYDIGRHDGVAYIVSELLEGQTLRRRLQESSPGWPQRRALQCAVDVARGLSAAHEKGIVHRDLKPENIFLTGDGHAKILDFGLAKLAVSVAADGSSPTAALDTHPGLVMGTAGYMSPEQLRGGRADHRSDIFAFGVVLYEMLSGRPPFTKPDGPETFAAVLQDQLPNLSETHPNVSSGIARIVDRCLEKDPAGRFQSTRDLAFALEGVAAGLDSARQPAAGDGRRFPIRRAVAIAGALIAAALLTAAAASYWRDEPRPGMPVRFQVTPPGAVFYTATASFVSVSPDGTRLAMSSTTRTGTSMIWVRSLDALEFVPIAGSEGGSQPFWSPDGQAVAFFADGRLKSAQLASGAVQAVCDVALTATGGTWHANGTILFSTVRGPIFRVQAAGGTPAEVTTLDAANAERSHLYPLFLPDGKRFLFFAQNEVPANSAIYVHSIEGGSKELVLAGGSRFGYVSAGYLVYAREGALVAHAFDARSARVVGDPITARERVDQYAETGNATFAVSGTGVLAYRNSIEGATSRLIWTDRRGTVLGTVGNPANYRNPRLSPDRSRVAVEIVDRTGNRDIFILDVARNISTRFTFDSGRDASPVWIDKGSRIVWQGPTRLYVKPSNGAGREEVLHPEPWIPDDEVSGGGGLLLHPGQPRQIWLLPLSGADRSMKPVVDERTLITQARLSPDGKWLAYASSNAGVFDIWLQAFPTPSGKWRASTEGGIQPKWRGDGKELFYIAPTGTLMAVPITYGGSIEPGPPVPLFPMGVETTTGAFWHQYDVTPDGQRFLTNARVDGTTGPMTVVLDWPQSFRR